MSICSHAARFRQRTQGQILGEFWCAFISYTSPPHAVMGRNVSVWITFGVLLTILHQFKVLLLWGMEEGGSGAMQPLASFFRVVQLILRSC